MINKIKQILDDNKAEYKMHEVPEGVGSSVAEHIAAFGLNFSDGCSTLVFSTDKGFVALLRRDDCKINSKKFKKSIGAKSLRFAEPDELKKITGYEIGLVSPITLDIPVFMDQKVSEKDKVRVGTGGNKFSLEINVNDLQKITKAEIVDVGEISEQVAHQKDLSEMVVFSGINPSSSKGLHLGNFLGAGKQHVELQGKAKKAMYFIADYHSLNTVFDGNLLRSNVYNTYLDYLSFGLDPEAENVTFFVESGVPEIGELNVILNNVISMAELKRMHAYKDKFASGVSEDSINHGLFNYPVLMASDILAFGSDVVPVGEDQVQHVEITRDIARNFNRKYGEVLNVPDVMVQKETARVIGIDGERKMSKSLGNHIPIFAPEDEIRTQIFAVTTDPNRIRPTDAGDPTKNPIFSYMKFLDFDNNKLMEYESRYKEGTIGDVEIKKEFYEFFLGYFGEMRKRRADYASRESDIREMMRRNNEEARAIAQANIQKVRKAIGLE